jgi:hypothetical protein
LKALIRARARAAQAAVVLSLASAAALGACVLPDFTIAGSSGTTGSAPAGSGSGGMTSTSGGAAGSGGTGGVGAAGTGGTGGATTTTTTTTTMAPCEQPGCVLWGTTFGGMGNERALAVATAQDRIALGGYYGDGKGVTFTLPPSPPLTCAGETDGFFARLESSGVPVSVISLPGLPDEPSIQRVHDVAVAGDGSTILAGVFTSTVDLDQPVFSMGSMDVFVASYDPAGNFKWKVTIGGSGDEDVAGLGVDSAGNVFVGGTYHDTFAVQGAGPQKFGQADVFLMKLDAATGAPAWLRSFGSPSDDMATGVAVDPKGNATIVGYFFTQIGFDDSDVLPLDGLVEGFAVHVDTNGGYLWRKGLGKTGNTLAHAAAAGAGGDVYITGTLDGSIDLGSGGVLTNVAASPADIFVVQLSEGTGGATFKTQIADVTLPELLQLTAVPGQGFAVTGSFQGSANFGDGAVTTDGIDAFVVRYGAQNQHAWSRTFGGAGTQRIDAPALDATGALLVAGDFDIAIDLGSGSVPAKGGADGFLAKLRP